MSHHLVTRMEPHRSSIFGEMSALATRLGAVNLGQGFPDTEGPALLRDAAIEALWCGARNGGSRTSGRSGARSPATEWIRVTSRASAGSSTRGTAPIPWTAERS